jgi:hypothetical protein
MFIGLEEEPMSKQEKHLLLYTILLIKKKPLEIIEKVNDEFKDMEEYKSRINLNI